MALGLPGHSHVRFEIQITSQS